MRPEQVHYLSLEAGVISCIGHERRPLAGRQLQRGLEDLLDALTTVWFHGIAGGPGSWGRTGRAG